MRLCIFSNLMAKYPQETDLNDIVRMMRNSERLQSLCEQRRELLATNRREDADRIKKKLIPAFCPGAFLFDGKGRNNVIGLTDLCFLETDHISEDQIIKAMEVLRNDNHIVLCLRSISGDGLHLIARYRFKDMEQPSYRSMGKNRMNHTYGAVFKTLKNYYQGLLGVSVDSSGFNMERLCLMSFDKDLHYNPNAVPIVFIYEQQNIRKKPRRLLFEMNAENSENVDGNSEIIM